MGYSGENSDRFQIEALGCGDIPTASNSLRLKSSHIKEGAPLQNMPQHSKFASFQGNFTMNAQAARIVNGTIRVSPPRCVQHDDKWKRLRTLSFGAVCQSN